MRACRGTSAWRMRAQWPQRAPPRQPRVVERARPEVAMLLLQLGAGHWLGSAPAPARKVVNVRAR
eukprot:4795276-Prymnesium_polylepis.1